MVAVVTLVLAVLIFGGAFLLFRTLRRQRAQPSTQFLGAPIAFGTVVSLHNTHHGVNGTNYYDVSLDVQDPHGARFPAVTRELMWAGRNGTMQPGAVLPVRYRPDMPGAVELVEDLNDPGTQAQVQAAWAAMQSQRPNPPNPT